MTYEKYREAIHKKVCQHCIDRNQEGICSLTGDDQCGIEAHLPKIVKAVQSVQSTSLQDYVDVLREIVCADCKNQNSDGMCQLRSKVDCGLDRYFALIVEAIEEVDLRS